MRLLIAILISIPLVAQQGAAPAAQPAGEPQFSIEVGNRWASDVKGSSDAYRSMVNLGEGPKVLGLDLSLKDGAHWLFDKFEVRGNGWGGEPYSTAHATAEKDRAYRLSVDYRNIAYFDSLPSFANPGLDRGILASQRSYNIRRRMIDSEIEFVRSRRIIPYLAYSRDWGAGDGVTDFTADANEYAVRNLSNDQTSNYRGGVRFEYNRFHATLEQGGTTFKDDQRVYQPAGVNSGNRTSTFLGQPLVLSFLNQAYRARGTSKYSKAQVTANPFSWINLSGQFLYSLPSSDVKLTQVDTGNLFSADSFSFFTYEQMLAVSEAKQPHTSGSFGAEVRVHRRIRVFESLMTDRFHTTSTLLSLTDLLSPGGTTTQPATGLERLQVNYNRQELNVLFDVAPKLTLRGGHRYVWGDALTRAPGLSQTGPQRTGELRMQVGLAGLSYRPTSKLSAYFDFEGGAADRNYFRTSLQDYHRVQARARYQVASQLGLSANFSQLSNENPATTSRYTFENRNNSLTAYWTPWGGKWISLTADYTRTTVDSNLSYLVPQTLKPDQSHYVERAHVGTAVLDLKLPKLTSAGAPKLTLGGSLFASGGSRATRFYQPMGELAVPFHRRASLFGQWRWYGYGEQLYQYEGFRVHHFILGLRLAM